jgi:hypothetical protein
MSRYDATDAVEDLTSFAIPFSALFPLSGVVTNAVTRTGEACARAGLEWHDELVRFVGSRVRADLDLGRSIADVWHVADVFKLQQEWAAAALRAYFDGTGKLSEIAYRAARIGGSTLYEAKQPSLPQGSGKAKSAAVAAE